MDGKEFGCSDMTTWLTHNIPVKECGYRGIVRVDGKLTLEGKFVLTSANPPEIVRSI